MNTFAWLLFFLVCKALLAILGILTEEIGFAPDEAQYWTWSQALDFGYYSKPPGVAWQIWLGTELFGNTELGVRFIAVVWNFLLPQATYGLARAAGTHKTTAFWAGIVMAFAPLGIMGAFLATTDGAMVVFWTLACLSIARALEKEVSPNYRVVGVAILLGALFKWPIYLLWVLLVALMLWIPKLWHKSLFSGILISLVGLTPSLYWNATHDLATFRHVWATIQGGHGTAALTQSNFASFVGSQFLLLSPILFGLLLAGLVHLVKERGRLPEALRFCGALTGVILATYTLLSCFQKIQGNWCVYAYPTGIVFLCWYGCEKLGKKHLVVAGVTLALVISGIGLMIPSLQERQLLGNTSLPYRINPFRHYVGWNRLAPVLEEAGYDPENHFLFGDKYQMTSILSFYAPGQKRAYFLNMQGSRKNQFSYWPGMELEQVGKTGFYVNVENSPHLERNQEEVITKKGRELEKYFASVEFLGVQPLFSCYGAPVKGALIFRCTNYNGTLPTQPEKY